jgi:PEP-CTERM motif
MRTANVKMKVKKNQKIAAVALVLGLVVSVVSSRAQNLDLSGGAIVGLTNSPLTGVGFFPPGNNGAPNGSISSWVVNDPLFDPLGLTFVYQSVNNGPDAIDQVELTSSLFTPSHVVATGTYSALTGSLFLPASVTPDPAGNFPTPSIFGGTVTFENGQLNTGNTPSYFLVVETDLNSFTTSYGQIQDDFTAIGDILAPASVPEPPSSIMLLAGLGGLFGILKIRRSAKLKA